MKLIEVKRLTKFEKLNGELQMGEARAFGTKLPSGMEWRRRSLVAAIANDRCSSIDIGLLASRYRDHFKIEQAWMPLGESIAHSLGFKSYTSLNSLMNAAIQASKIPESLLAAVIEQGIDLTENKYGPLVKDLQCMNFTGDNDDAHTLAQTAIDRFRARRKEAAEKRKKDKLTSAAHIGDRIARQLAANLREMPSSALTDHVERIVQHIEEAIRAQIPGCTIQVAWMKSIPGTQVAAPAVSTSQSQALPTRGELLSLRSQATHCAISKSPKSGAAPLPEEQSADLHGSQSHRKLPERSIETEQLGLFGGPAEQAGRG